MTCILIIVGLNFARMNTVALFLNESESIFKFGDVFGMLRQQCLDCHIID